MTNAVAELLEASKVLSIADRMALADAIWESISIDDGWRPSEAVLKELDRRTAEHDRDPSTAIEWPEMQSRLEALRAKLS